MAARNAAGMVTVDVNGDAAADVYTGGETTAGSGAWNSVTLTKTDASTEASDTVVLYTDIAAPTDSLLTTVYNQTKLDDALDPERVAKAASVGFPSGPGVVTWTYTGAAGERAKTVDGTFDGVAGQFTCTTPTCIVSTNNKGKLATSEGWRFTPVSPLTDTVKVPDATYAYFGWWLNKPKDNGEMHMVEVFAGGVGEGFAASPSALIVGNADYAGPAAGKYVTRTFSAGVHSDSGVGHFTANAKLKAKFGNASDGGMIGGSVTGFVLDDVTAAPSWKVLLKDTTISDATFNGMTEVTFGGAITHDDAGAWQGSFYDAGAADTDAPGTVAGTFSGLTEHASVVGAFGATKQ